jgi:hypothetical protein
MPQGLPATVRAAYEDRTPRPVHATDPDRLRGHAEHPIRPANFISGYESMPVRFSPGPAIGHS